MFSSLSWRTLYLFFLGLRVDLVATHLNKTDLRREREEVEYGNNQAAGNGRKSQQDEAAVWASFTLEDACVCTGEGKPCYPQSLWKSPF